MICKFCQFESEDVLLFTYDSRTKKPLSQCKNCANKRNREIVNINTWITRLVKNKPCMDCGEKFPFYIMDFDHRQGTVKRFNISKTMLCSHITLLEEIIKCDVICSNCHRERTFERAKGTRGEFKVLDKSDSLKIIKILESIEERIIKITNGQEKRKSPRINYKLNKRKEQENS